MNYYQKTANLSPKTLKTFNKILKYAKKEFSKKGYFNTSIHTIAAKARLSVGCLYKYFSSKDELYYFIIDDEQRLIREQLNRFISHCTTREEREKEGLRGWLTYVRDNPGVYKLIWETLFINKEAFDKYYVLFARSYSKGLFLDSNELTNQDYETISYMLIGISNFLGIKLITKKGEISDSEIDEMIETASYILKNGLFKQ